MKKTLIVSLLTISLLAPAMSANAVFGLGSCGAAGAGGAGASAASRATAVPVVESILRANSNIQVTKECVLDGLAYVLSESLISAITGNIISWINSGFEGGPAYVTDLSAFLGDIADTEATNFISGSELGNVCSTFEQPVRQALARQYEAQKSFSRQISCTAEGSSGNFGAFLDGDFTQGGWKTWLTISIDPQNNPIGAYAIAESERDARIAAKQYEETQLLEYGDGFFSKGECVFHGNTNYEVDPETGIPTMKVTPATNTKQGCEEQGGSWSIVTPGSQVNNLLSKWLGVSADKLAAADEIDEVLNALLAQLSQQIFTSLDGLKGLSSNSSPSSFNRKSYVRTLSQSADTATLASARSVLVSDIKAAITYEETYLGILDEIVVGYSAAESNFESVYNICKNSGNTNLAASATSTLSSSIIPLLSDYQNERSASATTINILTTLLADAQTSTTANALNAVGDQYQSVIDSGVIHIDSDILFLANERDAQIGTFSTYSTQSATNILACGGTP